MAMKVLNEVLTPTALTFKIAGTATFCALVSGGTLAWVTTGHRSFWAASLEAVILLPLVLPPTVLGFYLLSILGRSGLIGGLLFRFFNLEIIFTPAAAVVAASVGATPIMFKACKSFFEIADHDLLSAARLDGASEWQLLLFLRLPLASKGLMAGLLLAFLRAMGEFGATFMLAGNIPGRTQTLSLAIWGRMMSGDLINAHYLAFVLAILCITLIIGARIIDIKLAE